MKVLHMGISTKLIVHVLGPRLFTSVWERTLYRMGLLSLSLAFSLHLVTSKQARPVVKKYENFVESPAW